jgi:PPOX class probable F420-dependent enzyme
MSVIDESTDFGALAARHLREDRVVWLTTVTPGGAPLPSPVWFWWDGEETVHIHSLPDAARVKNISRNGNVSLNFPGTSGGGDIVILSGEAALSPDAPGADADSAYAEKYAAAFERLGLTAEQFAGRYSMPVRIKLTKLRGHA